MTNKIEHFQMQMVSVEPLTEAAWHNLRNELKDKLSIGDVPLNYYLYHSISMGMKMELLLTSDRMVENDLAQMQYNEILTGNSLFPVFINCV